MYFFFQNSLNKIYLNQSLNILKSEIITKICEIKL
jgi:hypothetical protein